MSQDEIGYFYHHWVYYRKAAVSVLMRNDHGEPSRGSLRDDIASWGTGEGADVTCTAITAHIQQNCVLLVLTSKKQFNI